MIKRTQGSGASARVDRRSSDTDAGKRLTQLEHHVIELETVTEQQQTMLGQHLPRLRQAIAAHRGNLAALERSLDTTAPDTGL